MLIGNIAVWLAVWCFLFRGLSRVESVQANLLLVQGLLLFDTLIMVWSYTEAARGQVEVALILRRESNKPIVVSTHDDEFCLQNIGPGVALNSFIVVPVGPHAP